MTCFFQISSVWQSILLVISQFAVIFLATGFILLLKRKCKLPKMIGIGSLLLLDVVLYVIMQLDSRMTGAEQGLHLHIPYAVLLSVTLLTIALGVWMVLGETKNRKTINNTSIKEAFDNLPTGVCFFNEIGIPVLCNRAMHSFSFAVSGKDIQYVDDLQNCLSEDFIPIEGAEKSGKIFTLSDGCVWQLEKRNIVYDLHHLRLLFYDISIQLIAFFVNCYAKNEK